MVMQSISSDFFLTYTICLNIIILDSNPLLSNPLSAQLSFSIPLESKKETDKFNYQSFKYFPSPIFCLQSSKTIFTRRTQKTQHIVVLIANVYLQQCRMGIQPDHNGKRHKQVWRNSCAGLCSVPPRRGQIPAMSVQCFCPGKPIMDSQTQDFYGAGNQHKPHCTA